MFADSRHFSLSSHAQLIFLSNRLCLTLDVFPPVENSTKQNFLFKHNPGLLKWSLPLKVAVWSSQWCHLPSWGVFHGPWSQSAQNKDIFLLLFFTCRVMIIWKWTGLKTLGLEMLPAFNCFHHIWLISWNQTGWMHQMILALLLVCLSTWKKCITWELPVKFSLGQNEDCSLRDNTADSSEKWLQRDRGKGQYICDFREGKVHAIKHMFFQKVSALLVRPPVSHNEQSSLWRILMLF